MNRSFFYEAELAAGATFGTWFGAESPAHFGNDAEELRAARETCAMFDLSGWTIVQPAGKDARDYLHRRLSNHVKQLKQGESVYATLMGGDGRMITDVTVCDAGSETLFLFSPPEARGTLAPQMEKYVIMEDVTVQDRSNELAALCICNPAAATLSLPQAISFPIVWPGAAQLYLVPADQANAAWQQCADALRQGGGTPAGYLAWNTMRIEDGVPLFGVDMNTTTIPLEANLDHAIDFNKGCFPGQEIVARINNLGHPAKKLVGLKLAPEDLPEPGAEILWGGKAVGRITSAVISPTLNQALALGYVKWDVREPGTTVEVQNVNEPAPAVICTLPFIR